MRSTLTYIFTCFFAIFTYSHKCEIFALSNLTTAATDTVNFCALDKNTYYSSSSSKQIFKLSKKNCVSLAAARLDEVFCRNKIGKPYRHIAITDWICIYIEYCVRDV